MSGMSNINLVISESARGDSIRVHCEGCGRIRQRVDGSVTMKTSRGDIVFHPLITYHSFDGEKRAVPGGFVKLGGSSIGFRSPAGDSRNSVKRVTDTVH
jgi:hypothetical protein